MQTATKKKQKTGTVKLRIKSKPQARKLRVTVEGYVPPVKPKVTFQKSSYVPEQRPKAKDAVKAVIFANGENIETIWIKVAFITAHAITGTICSETFWPKRHLLHKDSPITIKRNQVHAHLTNLTWLPSGFFDKK